MLLCVKSLQEIASEINDRYKSLIESFWFQDPEESPLFDEIAEGLESDPF